MRIVASDYDGTLFTHGRFNGDVIPAIAKWRKAGNVFGIATGRDYTMATFETDRWGIPFDFLICINGAAIYDHDKTLLKAHFIKDSKLPAVLRHPAALASMHCLCSGIGPLRGIIRKESWLPRLGIPIENIDLDAALLQKELGQISLAYKTEAECQDWEILLREDLGEHIAIHRNLYMMDVNPLGVDKATGIADLIALKRWENGRVATIGDGGNDLAMIRAYNGFTVRGASEEVVKAARKVYDNVPALLEDLQ